MNQCINSIESIINKLQNTLDINDSCTSLTLPDIATEIADINAHCSNSTCSLTHIASKQNHVLMNYDIPINTFVAFLIRLDDTNNSNIRASNTWENIFSTVPPPSINQLSNTDISEYYSLLSWCTLLKLFVKNAISVNKRNTQFLEHQSTNTQQQLHMRKNRLVHCKQIQQRTQCLQLIADNPEAFYT